ncbi:hypothetical protein AHOG_19545 [Actinoalloteichus hoggarensis]|uniref:Uncharacterized protein n=2 Tax=Actinoalloteichus hoggarensis TaxID=1470176 RepID=A0A221W752_9PSEU|nr:hypothetical protein AHOG_19545 [Actinoalloteichus hoggarensis]
MTFLVDLVASGTVPAPRRLDVSLCLVFAADRLADGLLADADRAAAESRLPTAAPWAQEVYQAVGTGLSTLLARWNTEPPAMQYVLACLPALYPQHGRQIAQQVSALTPAYAGTRHGAYPRLADALVNEDDERAVVIASDIVSWEDGLDPGWLEAPGISAAMKTGHVLAEGVTQTAEAST